MEINVALVTDAKGEPRHIQSIVRDISHHLHTQERLRYLANHDRLTGLPNRELFRDRLDHALARSRRNQDMVVVMLLDLDNFKEVNDSMGHAVRDLVLCEVAQRLQGCMRESDTVARMGGDEFTIILEDVQSRQNGADVAEKILHSLTRPFQLDEFIHNITASIGISVALQDGEDVDTLLKKADHAMYQAKLHKDSFCYYHP